MSKKIITEDLLTKIADAIRAKTGKTDKLTPAQMAEEITGIKYGGDTLDRPSFFMYRFKLTNNDPQPDLDVDKFLRVCPAPTSINGCFSEINGFGMRTLLDAAVEYLQGADLAGVTDAALAFYDTDFPYDYVFPSISLPICKNIDDMFRGTTGDNEVDFSGVRIGGIESMQRVFRDSRICKIVGLDAWDTKNVTNMQDAFYNCNWLTEIKGIQNWDTHNVTNMDEMFYYDNNIKTLDLSSFNTRNVSSYDRMFYGMYSLNKLIFGPDYTLDFDPSQTQYLKQLVIKREDAVLTLTENFNSIESVYVPDTLVDSYKSATNWSTVADKIHPLSEYTEDTTA